MSSPSNLYAEKIFAEHPIALWPLDDTVNYFSLIVESDRDLTSWTISNGTAQTETNISEEPFISSYVTELSGDVPEDDIGQVSAISNNVQNFLDLDSEIGTISIGTYIYSLNAYITSIEIGYEYEDPDTLETIQVLKSKDTPIVSKWFLILETFEFPEIDADFRIVLKINYDSGDEVVLEGDFKFLVNGLSLGQASEEYQAQSLGVNPISIPEGIAVDAELGVESSVYGLQELSGYYLAVGNKLMAKNTGFPMVYGASNITKILPNSGDPSVIIPGAGFLNKLGQYKEYSAEMWIRLISDTTEPKRIFGPIASDDGIYVYGQFILIKVGNSVGSYFVGEWFRPMLLQFEIINNSASLLMNGEQVISLNFLTSELELADPTNELGDSQDWLGFYGYEDVYPFEIDAIALYSYQVPEIVAKRRFVYGQGVEFPESINSSYNGESVFIDYPFAKYSNNYSYPDIGRWNQGIVENLSTSNNNLSVPEYPLPSLVINGRTEQQLLEALEEIQESETFITLKPNEEWAGINSHILFENIAFLKQPTKAFYGVYKVSQLPATSQTLFELINEQSNTRITATMLGSTISYKLISGEDETTFYSQGGYVINEKFFIGIDIDAASRFYGEKIATLLGSPNQLKLYVGGNKELTNKFLGKIYRFGFSTKKNLLKFTNAFGENGFCDESVASSNLTKTASYTLISNMLFNKFNLDIATDSYWEDYVPLTYFAKYVNDVRGDSYYSLDFIQINVNYPSANKYVTLEGSEYFDTTGSPLRTYISFQYLESGANANGGFFTETVPASKDRVIQASGNWINTKYEFVNNMIFTHQLG